MGRDTLHMDKNHQGTLTGLTLTLKRQRNVSDLGAHHNSQRCDKKHDIYTRIDAKQVLRLHVTSPALVQLQTLISRES